MMKSLIIDINGDNSTIPQNMNQSGVKEKCFKMSQRKRQKASGIAMPAHRG